jgi:multiple sugar transport system substrate-binding protein
LNSLAKIAGVPGSIDWKTGEYAYASDPYVNAVEFLSSMQKDGSLFPTSLLGMALAARRAAGSYSIS